MAAGYFELQHVEHLAVLQEDTFNAARRVAISAFQADLDDSDRENLVALLNNTAAQNELIGHLASALRVRY